MANDLRIQRQRLEELVSERTKELQEAMESLHRSDQERRRLIAEGNALLEEKRKRIATEIHDDLNASLIVLQLELHQIASLVGGLEPTATSKELASIAQRVCAMTARVYDSARAIVKQLRPEVIDTLGLEGALQEIVRTYDLAHPECEFSFRSAGQRRWLHAAA